MAKPINVVTIGVSSLEEMKDRMAAAFRGEPQGCWRSFISVELLWKVLNAKRWALLKAMTGRGPISIREAARLAKRDVKAVHGDVQILLKSGMIDRTEDGRIVFPFDEIHVEFKLSKEADEKAEAARKKRTRRKTA